MPPAITLLCLAVGSVVGFRGLHQPSRAAGRLPPRTHGIQMLRERFDLIVMGGGPVGVTAALRAAALGRTCIVIDATPPQKVAFAGPTGLFSKSLRDSAMRIDVSVLRSMGIGDAAIWEQVRGLIEQIMRKSGDNNAGALALARIPNLRGVGSLVLDDCETEPGCRCVEMTFLEDPASRPRRKGTIQLRSKNVLLATGSSAVRMPCLAPWYGAVLGGHVRCHDSDSINSLSFLPRSVAIVGGGIIAVEFARIFRLLDARVTMIVRASDLPKSLARVGIDAELATLLQNDLVAEGVELLFEREVDSAAPANGASKSLRDRRRGGGKAPQQQLDLHLCRAGGEPVGEGEQSSLAVDLVLSATGRRARSSKLGIELLDGALAPNGDLCVDESLMTCVQGVYGAGDVIGAPQLASTGISQAEAAVEAMFGDAECFSQACSPAALLSNAARYPIGIWTVPEMAFVGLTVDAALAEPHCLDVVEGVGRYADTIRGHVHTVGTAREGSYLQAAAAQGPQHHTAHKLNGPALKLVVVRAAPHVIVGVHVFGDDACELIHYGTTLVQGRKTLADVLSLCFAAVTYHELFKLAAKDAVNTLQRDQWRELYVSMDADGDGSGLLEEEELRKRLSRFDASEETTKEIVRTIFTGASSVSVDTFIKRAMRLESYQQLELMSGSSFSLR